MGQRMTSTGLVGTGHCELGSEAGQQRALACRRPAQLPPEDVQEGAARQGIPSRHGNQEASPTSARPLWLQSEAYFLIKVGEVTLILSWSLMRRGTCRGPMQACFSHQALPTAPRASLPSPVPLLR